MSLIEVIRFSATPPKTYTFASGSSAFEALATL